MWLKKHVQEEIMGRKDAQRNLGESVPGKRGFGKRMLCKGMLGMAAKGLALGMAVAMTICMAVPTVHAAQAPGAPEFSELIPTSENQVKAIVDAEGLLRMAEDPDGMYVLAADIQMEGVEWKPFAFHGTLYGFGHSILNLTIAETGKAVRETFDGNMKVYDTYFAGLFDELSGGRVCELNLVNVRIDVETDQPCFIGPIAGYMENSSIENCNVSGVLQLRAHDRMFGVGGIIGYGCGAISGCNTDVTLVCIDTDASTKDEQFMGGICAAGYPDMQNNNVTIAGFDSDHGYVHDGGLVGMYMFYPKGQKYRGTITDNYVAGKITFYEDNKNRRAYCNGFIGEIMNWDFENGRNKNDFVRDEVYTYDVDLVPHMCENPVMREEIVEAGCEFGYVRYVCETCGYEEKDHYTLKNHDYEWTVTLEATEDAEGERHGVCKICGADTYELIPKVIPVVTPTPEPQQTFEEVTYPDPSEAAENADPADGEKGALDSPVTKGLIIGGCAIVIIGLFLTIIFRKRK